MSFEQRRLAVVAPRMLQARRPELDDERRVALRKSSILPGHIISDRLQGTVPCVVRDLSATGARLVLQPDRNSVVASAEALPATFKLLIERENVEIDCQLQWARERAAGVDRKSTRLNSSH